MKKRYALAGVGVLAIGLALWLRPEPSPTVAPTAAAAAPGIGQALTPEEMDQALAALPPEREPASAQENIADQPLDPVERESVDRLSRMLADAESMKSTRELTSELKRAGLKPVIGRDENPDTGRLDIVRTRDALPGTRYFHAQMFGDGKTAFAQHLSFQVRPGKDSMDVALQAIQATHPGLGRPETQKDGLVIWRSEGRVISARRMTAEDLADDHFNAQDPVRDVGTIWITSEDDPEDSDEH